MARSATIASLLVKFGADTSGLQQGLKKSESSVKSSVATMKQSLLAVGAAAAAVGAGLGVLGIRAVKMAGDLEQTRLAFTTMLGSAEQADAFIKDLYAFAAKTPFEFEGLTDASRKLLAFGFEAEKIIPIMTNVGNAVAGLGGSAFEIDRVTRALGQMKAKGKVSAEEMMQLAELGIPVWEILAEKIGTTIPNAMKRASQGAITAAEGIDGILEGIGERFPGMMEKQSKTLLGLWSTLKDVITQQTTEIGQKLTSAFDLKAKLEAGIKWLEGIGPWLQEKVIPAVTETLQQVIEASKAFVAGAKPVFLDLFEWLKDQGGKTSAMFERLGPTIDSLKKQLESWMPSLSGIWDTLLETMGAGLDQWRGIFETTLRLMNGDWKGAWQAIKDTWDRIWNQGIFKQLKSSMYHVISFFWDMRAQGLEQVQAMLNGFLKFSENLMNLPFVGPQLSAAAKASFDAIVGDIGGMDEAIKRSHEKTSEWEKKAKDALGGVKESVKMVHSEWVTIPVAAEDSAKRTDTALGDITKATGRAIEGHLSGGFERGSQKGKESFDKVRKTIESTPIKVPIIWDNMDQLEGLIQDTVSRALRNAGSAAAAAEIP